MKKTEPEQKIPVAVVCGPTASGKTALAVELALRFGGEVISADSMQIYRDLPVGTAQPSQEEMRGVPHHLIGFCGWDTPFSVADYLKLAARCIQEIRARGRLPVLAGGTGLYLSSLLHNLSLAREPRDDALRQNLEQRARQEGGAALLEELRAFDPETAARLHPKDVKRIVRAVELYRLTGKTMTRQREESRRLPSPYRACWLGLAFEDRQLLYQRINRRRHRETGHRLQGAFPLFAGGMLSGRGGGNPQARDAALCQAPAYLVPPGGRDPLAEIGSAGRPRFAGTGRRAG